MLKRVLAVLLLIILIVGGATWWWFHRWPSAPMVKVISQADGRLLTMAAPKGEPHARVLLATPPDLQLSDADLLSLATNTGAELVQYEIVPQQDCKTETADFDDAAKHLSAPPTFVGGIGPGAARAWRWLASQDNDKAAALSVGFDIGNLDCPDPLPEKAEHGKWHIAWNDHPTDDSAIFVRKQPNADLTIADYGTALPVVLREQLKTRLLGEHNDVPIIEMPADPDVKPGHPDTVTIFYSGDGGWRDIDRLSAQSMNEDGYPVVGIDSLRYFWQHKSPEQVAADLANLMQEYREKWHAKHFVLAGYSFGADILPAVYNRLPKADQDQITTLLLLAYSRKSNFEIAVEGWLGKPGDEADNLPEAKLIPAAKLFCVYGAEEKDDSGCTEPGMPGEKLERPGGHHFDENYDKLADFMVKAIQDRTPQ